MLSLLLSAPAYAHYPHDVVQAVARAPDFASSGRAWIVEGEGFVNLLRTDDHGAHWRFVGGRPIADDLVAAAELDDALALVAADGRIWLSDDEGASWQSWELGAEVRDLVHRDGRTWLATDEGLYAGDLREGLELVLGLPVEAVAVDREAPEIVAAVGLGLGLAVSEDGGERFDRVLPLEAPPLDVELLDGRAYVGLEGGGAVVLDRDALWLEPCSTPEGSGSGPADDSVAKLGVSDDGRLLAATAYQALFTSDDRCATWAWHPTGETVPYGGSEGADDATEAFEALWWDGERAWVAGFMGLATSDDGGATWRSAKLLPEAHFRGVGWAADFPDDPRLFLGGYGGGVRWTADGGASWEGTATGVEDPYSFGLHHETFGDDERLYYAGGYLPYELVGGAFHGLTERSGLGTVWAWARAAGAVWALGVEGEEWGGAPSLAWTDDGETWSTLEGPGGGPELVVDAWLGDEQALVLVTASPGAVLSSPDGGLSWAEQAVFADEDLTVGFAQPWPERWVYAGDASGIWWSDDGSAWQAAQPFDGRVGHLVAGDDGRLFAADRAGALYGSLDGGETWEARGERLPAQIQDVEPAPGFADHPWVLVGTTDGAFVWDDDAGGWHALPRFERFEATSYHLACEGVCAPYRDAGHGMDGGWDLVAGDEVRFTFRGDGFRLLADGPLLAEVDGEAHGALDELELAAGFHEVVLVAEQTVRLDAVEAWETGTPLGFEEHGDDARHEDDLPGSRCSCGSSPGGPWLAALAVLGWRRRRTGC